MVDNNSGRPLTRQQMYDRIRETSKDEFILDQMIRLGFWPREGVLPKDPADEIRRRGELERELTSLRNDANRWQNIEHLKREAYKQRLADSRKKRKENKLRRERERIERFARWREKQTKDIVYVGHGDEHMGEYVSSSLSYRTPDLIKLPLARLPILPDIPALANALGIDIKRLRFLAYHRSVSTVHHYRRFALPKKTGGTRQISAPMPQLKKAQRWILDAILKPALAKQVHDDAHGFLPERSIVTNARPHVGKDVLINIDLQDFFPSILYPRVRGVFRNLGYSDAMSTLLALLCTELPVNEATLDGKRYFVAAGTRHLPQGAPTSPAITNLLCRKLDRRLHGAAASLGFVYTRYADDLTFSTTIAKTDGVAEDAQALRARTGRMLRFVKKIIQSENFLLHPKKTRILRRASRQEVTGLTVNDKLGVDKHLLKNFRATLFHIEKDGVQGKHWQGAHDAAVIPALVGFANYICMVDPTKGQPLKEKALALATKHGVAAHIPHKTPVKATAAIKTDTNTNTPPTAHMDTNTNAGANPASNTETHAAQKKDPNKKWWQIF